MLISYGQCSAEQGMSLTISIAFSGNPSWSGTQWLHRCCIQFNFKFTHRCNHCRLDHEGCLKNAMLMFNDMLCTAEHYRYEPSMLILLAIRCTDELISTTCLTQPCKAAMTRMMLRFVSCSLQVLSIGTTGQKQCSEFCSECKSGWWQPRKRGSLEKSCAGGCAVMSMERRHH